MNTHQLADMLNVTASTAGKYLTGKSPKIPSKVQANPITGKMERVITLAAAKAALAAKRPGGRPRNPGMSQQEIRRLAYRFVASRIEIEEMEEDITWPASPVDSARLALAVRSIRRSLEKRGGAKGG